MRTLSPSAAEALETRALLDAEKYLHQLRVTSHLVDIMFAKSSTEIHWLSADELQYELGQRPPWYEEFLIARCGLNKEREARSHTHPTLEDQSPEWRNERLRVHYCGESLTHDEAKTAYARLVKEKQKIDAKQWEVIRVEPIQQK
jgi:hypothetical protein